MEFGNLKKRLALGLSGVMAFTMAVPVGLTGQQEASEVKAADTFQFVASAYTSVELNTMIKVGEINTKSVDTLYNAQARKISVSIDEDYAYATVTDAALNVDSDNLAAGSARVATAPTNVPIGITAEANKITTGANANVYVQGIKKTEGSTDLTIQALTDAGTEKGVQTIPITVVDPQSIKFDIRTDKADKTVITDKEVSMTNVKSLPVYVNVNTTSVGTKTMAVQTLEVDNSNTALVQVRTDATLGNRGYNQTNSQSSNPSFGWTGAECIKVAPYNSALKVFVLPNWNAKGTATVKVRVHYIDGNNKPQKTDYQKFTVNVKDMKNTLTANYQTESYDITLNSEDSDSKYKKFIGVEPKKAASEVENAVKSGWAIRLDNTNNTSAIDASSDRGDESAITYTVVTGSANGETGSAKQNLDEYLAISNSGKLSLKKAIEDVCTGVVAVVATGKTDEYEMSQYVYVPVRLDKKEKGSLVIKEGDNKVINGYKNGKKAVENAKDVYLSTDDVKEKTLTYESNVDPDYISWESNKPKVVKVTGGDGTIKLECLKTSGDDEEVTITGKIKESSTIDVESVQTYMTFKVKVTNKKLINPLTVENKVIYVQAGETDKKVSGSYEHGNIVEYVFAKYVGETNSYEEYTGADANSYNDGQLKLDRYTGALKVKDEKNSGAVFVKVKGSENDTHRADDEEIVHVFFNMNEDDSNDEITGTSKYTLEVGASQIIDAVSAKGSDLAYTSDDTTVATVDGSGKVTAVKPGTAVITVKSTGYDATMNVTIVVNKAAEEQDAITGTSSYSIKVGKTVESDAKSSNKNSLTWSTSNAKIATVSQNGVIKGVAAGTANVTATAENSGAKFVIKVTVSKNANTLTVKGKKVTKKVALKKNKTKKNFTIAAKNAYTVSNAQGTVTYAKKSGNGKITVAKNGKITVKKGIKKGTYTLKVNVTAAGNNSYKASTKVATVKIVIKKK